MKTVRLWSCLLMAGVVAAGTGCRRETPPPGQPRTGQTKRWLIGAHYYVWYPQNFGQGYLRGRLEPRQEPMLGAYVSADSKVVEQHIAWCTEYGIDFLSVSWWPNRPALHDVIRDSVLAAPNIGDIQFCIFYETQNLGFDVATGSTRFTDEVVDRFIADMEMFADTMFDHPSYLKIDGRPVIILYLTRTFSGKFREAMQGMRARLAARGVDPYVIGDEIFWGVISHTDKRDGSPYGGRGPQMERIRLFDAITAYNMYCWSHTTHAGYGATSQFVADVERIYREYAEAVAPGIAFVPGVLPGYNDRGVRHGADHYVIPRQWDEGEPEGSFLAHVLERLAFPFADPNLNMILVTSFNEWNEDTAIEPLKPAPPTRQDSSPSGDLFTQGFAFEGVGSRHLDVLRDQVVAVSGRVTDSADNPVRGVEVSAWRGEEIVGSGRTDARGYYTLSRLRMPPGAYQVGVTAYAESETVEVDGSKTRTGMDFTVVGHGK